MAREPKPDMKTFARHHCRMTAIKTNRRDDEGGERGDVGWAKKGKDEKWKGKETINGHDWRRDERERAE